MCEIHISWILEVALGRLNKIHFDVNICIQILTYTNTNIYSVNFVLFKDIF